MKILVTAVGSMSALAAIHSLGRLTKEGVVGCDIHPPQWLPAAQALSRCYQVPLATDDRYLDSLFTLCARESITHLVPLTDPEADVLSQHREALTEINVKLCISDAAVITRCRDKWQVHEWLRQDVPVVPTLELEQWHQWRYAFPLLAKPRQGRSRIGHFVLASARDAEYLAMTVEQPYIVQPLLQGSICTVDVVRNQRSGKSVAVARQELIRTSNGAGLTVRLLPKSPLQELARTVCERLDINGCVNLEFLQQDQSFQLMDVNPRFSAGIAFSQFAGYDMVENHMRCFIGEEIDDARSYESLVVAKDYREKIIEAVSDV